VKYTAADFQIPYSGHLTEARPATDPNLRGVPKVTNEELYWKCRYHDTERTQISVALFPEVIEGLTKTNDIILDPFLGVGSCAIACMTLRTGRRFHGVDRNGKMLEITTHRLDTLGIKLHGEKRFPKGFTPNPSEKEVGASNII